jgi:hypothetical protein
VNRAVDSQKVNADNVTGFHSETSATSIDTPVGLSGQFRAASTILRSTKLLPQQRQHLVQRIGKMYGNQKTGRAVKEAVIQRDYAPSPTRQEFETAARAGNWENAYRLLNGLNMYEMLRALDTLRTAGSLPALWQARQQFQSTVNMPRIEYAYNVVTTRQLPTTAPGDLEATGQVADARSFLQPAPTPQPTPDGNGGQAPTPPQPQPQPQPSGVDVPPNSVEIPELPESELLCRDAPTEAFAGIAAIAHFARQLSQVHADRTANQQIRERHQTAVRAAERAERARQVPGENARDRQARIRAAGQAVTPEAREAVVTTLAQERLTWLENDFRLLMQGAVRRYGQNARVNTVARGWMVGRREQLDFQTLMPGNIRGLSNFDPTGEAATLVPIEAPGTGTPVDPVVNTFIHALAALHSRFAANNYAGHGGGAFRGRGLSLDLTLRGSLDERGFYQRQAAVDFLLLVHQAAQQSNLEWRVLYNDFAVARAVNQRTGARHVGFVGDNSGNLNWHGPLVLHFHLDLSPRPTPDGGTQPSAPSVTDAPPTTH